MLQNARVTAFSISELLRENQQGVKLATPLPPLPPHTHTQIRTKSPHQVTLSYPKKGLEQALTTKLFLSLPRIILHQHICVCIYVFCHSKSNQHLPFAFRIAHATLQIQLQYLEFFKGRLYNKGKLILMYVNLNGDLSQLSVSV